MRINSISIRKTGVFSEQNIDFERPLQGEPDIHIFTGPNGSGKSTLLHALAAGFNYSNSVGRCMVAHNDLHKRFHQFKEVAKGRYESEISIHLDNGESVRSWGCPNCRNMHISTFGGNQVSEYQSQMGLIERSSYEFDFAVYAASGYRIIEYQGTTNEISSKNPLFQSLVFEKNKPSLISIEEWIKDALLNKYATIGMAKEGNTTVNPEVHSEVIDRITNAIREIVGREFELLLQVQPSEVKFKYGGSNKELEFNLLADGVKSMISWMIDLAKMLDTLNWKDKSVSVLNQKVIVFLDEIEVHLHPLWQRKVLSIVAHLFPNAQFFVSTHSPFITNSIDNAWVYKLKLGEDGHTTLEKHKTSTARSYFTEYASIFDVEDEFGIETENKLVTFLEDIKETIASKSPESIQRVKQSAMLLMKMNSLAIENTVGIELRKLKRIHNIDVEMYD